MKPRVFGETAAHGAESGGGGTGTDSVGTRVAEAERLVRVHTDTLEALPAVLKSGLEFVAWNPSDCPGAVTPIRSELTRG